MQLLYLLSMFILTFFIRETLWAVHSKPNVMDTEKYKFKIIIYERDIAKEFL